MTSRSDEAATSVYFPNRLLLATLALSVLACGWVIWNVYKAYTTAQTTGAVSGVLALMLLGSLLAAWLALRRSLHSWCSAILHEIAERTQAEVALRTNQAILHQIVAGTSVTGHAFFDALVRALAEALGVRYAFVAEVKPPASIARTIAVWANGAPGENFEYPLDGTPCQNVVNQRVCFHRSGVVALFPRDLLLAEMGVDSYLGIPLLSSAGGTLGLMVVLHESPIDESKLPVEVLQIFAARAAAELERIRAEVAARESEARFAKVFHTSPVAISISTLAEGRFLDVNESFLRLFGYQRAEVIGHTAIELQTWVDPSEREQMRRAIENQQPVHNLEGRYRAKSGAIGVVLESMEPIELGGERSLLYLAQDITERRRAETALRNHQAALRKIVDGTFVTGQAFFDALVTTLAETLGVRYALIAEVDTMQTRAQTVAVWKDGALAANFEYLLEGTPCQHVASPQVCFYRANVTALFPRDTSLAQMGVDSYLGVPLAISGHSALGHLAVLHNGPIDESLQPVELLQILAARAAAELERIRAERALHERLATEALISEISSHFITLSPAEVDGAIDDTLRQVGELLTVDRCAIWLFSENREFMINVHQWHATGIAQIVRAAWYAADHPWAVERLAQLQPIRMVRRDDLPTSARSERAEFQAYGIRSLLSIPLAHGRELIGMFNLITTQQERHWTDETCRLTKIVGEILANAIQHKKAALEIQMLAAHPRYNPNMILSFTAGGELAYFNGAAQAMAASSGTSDPRDILPPETAAIVKQCLETGQTRLRLETVLNQRMLSWSFFPISDLQVVHCYAVDITERLRMEAQLRQSQKMEAVGRLAGGVAHDFNNLLTVIIGSSDLALEILEDGHELYKDVEQIRQAGERAAALTRQLLAFSRQQVLELQTLDLNDIITDITKMLKRLIGEDIALHIMLQPDLGSVKADAGQIEQVIVNLALNARDAMPHGGHLTIETANVYLDERYAGHHVDVQPGAYTLLAVSDTGTGMDAEATAHIFEPFFTTKAKGKGTGLGLATVHGIVHQSGGDIWVYSEPGKGTTFKIYLPQTTAAADSPGLLPSAPALAQGSETVLLVEDDLEVRRLTRTILERKGYTVLEAAADDALEFTSEYPNHIHLLLTDVVMPTINGRELAERLVHARPGLKVLYMSGYTDAVLDIHGVLQTDGAFLPKPFTPRELAGKVRAVLDGFG